jgi:hypothetical protein
MLVRTLCFDQASIITAVVCCRIVAGLLKGTTGVGMPIVALPLLSLFIDIKSAAMLLSMPLITVYEFTSWLDAPAVFPGALPSPMSQYSPAITSAAERQSGISTCSSGACCEHEA